MRIDHTFDLCDIGLLIHNFSYIRKQQNLYQLSDISLFINFQF